MPASMIIALAGFMRKVSGSSMAMVAGGPRPGITPITVPSSTPTKHHSRFTGCRATAKPCISPETMSMLGKPHAEGEREHEIERRGRGDRHRGGHLEGPPVHHRDDEKSERGKAHQEARQLERRHRNRKRQPGDQGAAGPFDALA